MGGPPGSARLLLAAGQIQARSPSYTNRRLERRHAALLGLHQEDAGRGPGVKPARAQLLRRMADPGAGARYAVVVPTAAVQAALRVPAWVRQRLDVDVYEVDDAGRVLPRR